MQQIKGLLPCFLYLSGTQYKALSPDIIKWQYPQVIKVKLGLEISFSFLGSRRLLNQDPEILHLNAATKVQNSPSFPKTSFSYLQLPLCNNFSQQVSVNLRTKKQIKQQDEAVQNASFCLSESRSAEKKVFNVHDIAFHFS